MKQIQEVKVKEVWCYVLSENPLGVTIADPLTGNLIAVLWSDIESIK